MLRATQESYATILAWGQNTLKEWDHPVSRSQFADGLHAIKAGECIEFILDGRATTVEVVRVGEIYEYPLLKHTYGDFPLSDMKVDRVIRVKS
jgi:hypothetical protein